MGTRVLDIAYGDCDLADDRGGFGCWPVYTEIAALDGVPGSEPFLKAATPRTDPAHTMTRSTFIARSYAASARQAPEKPTSRPVDAWLSDGAVSAFLREIAGTSSSRAGRERMHASRAAGPMRQAATA